MISLKYPNSAVVAVTYKCNSRCQMCNIWKKETVSELPLFAFGKLPKGLDDINLTGGEPFLRNDMFEIVDLIIEKINPARITVSSNGYLTERILDFAKKVLEKNYKTVVMLSFSLDGPEEIHDSVRGVKGAFKMVERTISELKKIKYQNIGLGYTFVAGNEKEYSFVYEFSKKHDILFGATIAHNSDNYFSTQDNKKVNSEIVSEQIDQAIKERIGSFSKTELGKCYYLNGLKHYAQTSKALLPCDALRGSFFMDPEGNVYPCNIMTNSIGNILENDFDDIWQSEKAEAIRAVVKKCPNPCWMLCTAKPAIKRSWFRAGLWILKEKVFNLLRY